MGQEQGSEPIQPQDGPAGAQQTTRGLCVVCASQCSRTSEVACRQALWRGTVSAVPAPSTEILNTLIISQSGARRLSSFCIRFLVLIFRHYLEHQGVLATTTTLPSFVNLADRVLPAQQDTCGRMNHEPHRPSHQTKQPTSLPPLESPLTLLARKCQLTQLLIPLSRPQRRKCKEQTSRPRVGPGRLRRTRSCSRRR